MLDASKPETKVGCENLSKNGRWERSDSLPQDFLPNSRLFSQSGGWGP